jgi:hypothetical protein
MKLPEEERRRIQLHRKVAPPIPKTKQVKSLRGQAYFDFDRISAGRQTTHRKNRS